MEPFRFEDVDDSGEREHALVIDGAVLLHGELVPFAHFQVDSIIGLRPAFFQVFFTASA
jgi:hypothetical protein